MYQKFYPAISFLMLMGCSGPSWVQDAAHRDGVPEKEVIYAVPETVSHQPGDSAQGLYFLLNENYIGSGYPLKLLPAKARANFDSTNTEETRQKLDPAYSFVKDERRRVWIVQQNCFTCHGSPFQGEYVLGLGNSSKSGFTEKPGLKAKLTPLVARKKLGKNTMEHQAFQDLWQYLQKVQQEAVTPVIGVNPAFRIEEACAMHRNPADLSYTEIALFNIPKGPVPVADVPPLWHVGKKRALYYNGMGRGDFRKLLMQASVLGVKDSLEARKAFNQFNHVVAWAASLKAPKWPRPLDVALVENGKSIFANNCQKCHGSYGEQAVYPNKIIALSKIGTDPYYARYFYSHSGLPAWYNSSWFATSNAPSQMLPSLGYVAPPLDGIWATAPYLHNGSVPDLESLLNSSTRPAYWQHTAVPAQYNYELVGWAYSRVERPKGREVYNTSLPGYSNAGHTYGDKLSDKERKAVIEYLKTL